MIATLQTPLSLHAIAQAIHTTTDITPSPMIHRIVTDSRELMPGDLFIALNGEHYQGADFVEDALRLGAFAVCDRVAPGTLPTHDTRRALGHMAALYKRFLPELRCTVAITGSVGKTTTKEILRELLSTEYRVHATHGNLNNDIGLPMTILSAPADTQILVLEIGINHPGEMEALSCIASPDIAILTNVGHAHIGNFGSHTQLIREKCNIRLGMRDGPILTNAEEPRLIELPGRVGVSTADARAPYALIDREGTDSSVFYKHGMPIGTLSVPFTDTGAKQDCALALAAAELCGVPMDGCNACLSRFSAYGVRVTEHVCTDGMRLLDDSYNASPESMQNALDALSKHAKEGRCVLLGDMLELGDQTEQFHTVIGRMLSSYGVEKAFFFGVYAPFYRLGAREGGMPPQSIFINNDITDPSVTVRQIREHCTPRHTILCKASRATHLDRILRELLV